VPLSLWNPKYRQSLVFWLFSSSISVYVAALSILQVFKAALDLTFSCADSTCGMGRRLGLILTVTSYATVWTGRCMQIAQSTHKTRPHLVRPLWLVTQNWSSCYLCVWWQVSQQHLMTIAPRYRKVDESAINIAISCNQYDPYILYIFYCFLIIF